MGYPTIDKFDIKFIQRTKANVKGFTGDNKFTHLLNSLIGLVFVPHEFNNKGRRTFKVNFLNKSISDYPILSRIFVGNVQLTNEQGQQFQQRKFYYRDNAGQEQTIQNTTVGNLVRLFRNSIAHQNITPVAEGNYWKGIIVKNYKNKTDTANDNFNFEAFLNQKEVRLFATLIADEYLKNAQT